MGLSLRGRHLTSNGVNVERIEVDEWGLPDSPSGSWRQGYVVYEETNDLLVSGIEALIKQTANEYWICVSGRPKLTVHKCWSGYSEYTVTSEWDEIDIDWDGHHFYFEHLSLFFKALEAAVEWERNH